MKRNIFELVTEPYAELILTRSGKNHPFRALRHLPLPTQKERMEMKQGRAETSKKISEMFQEDNKLKKWNEWRPTKTESVLWVTNGQGYEEKLTEF